jgi:hypothetical protein
LQRALQQKERETEKIFSGIAISQVLNNRCIWSLNKDLFQLSAYVELRYKHDVETAHWEGLMHASQELVRQQAAKHKEQVSLHSPNLSIDEFLICKMTI